MGFDTCERYDKGGIFRRLADDGDTMEFVFLAEPEPIRNRLRDGTTATQFAFPILDEDGVGVLAVGVTEYRDIRDNWTKLNGKQCERERIGKKGDKRTRYRIKTTSGDALINAAGDLDATEIDAMMAKVIDGTIARDDSGDIPF